MTNPINAPTPRLEHAFNVIRKAMGGLAEWRLFLQVEDNPGNETNADGCVWVDARYRKATISVRRGLEERREREVLAHEMTHILCGTIELFHNRILDIVPKDQRKVVKGMYNDALEPVCERLAFAILELIPASEWSVNDGQVTGGSEAAAKREDSVPGQDVSGNQQADDGDSKGQEAGSPGV